MISRVVSLLSLFFFFFPNHFLRLAGVYPPGCALKISANKKEGTWLNHQRNPAAHTQAIRNLPSLRDPGEENSPRMWHTESSPQPATESSSCLLLPSDSVTSLICLCGCLFAAEWISSCSQDSHSTSLHLQSAERRGMPQIPGS